MGLKDKAVNAAQGAKGRTKEAVGKISGDGDLEAEGRGDQVTSSLKKAGENVKDAVKDATGH